ncbi:MAG: glycosyltransferase [Ignavibacteria bacterium]|nr:glycosyltransferase [Ignavibacteria bacterium]MCC7159239.1 glycosyltransferase [Ignavibacteria bacterium]
MIYILLPVYNEAANVPLLRKELAEYFRNYRVYYVFSDDGSVDGSRELINEHFAEEKFVVLGDGTNHGPGFAFNLGFEWIMANSADPDGDKIISMEADCTADLSIVDTMIKISDIGFELVLASVYVEGGGFEKTSWLRKFLSFFANMFLRQKFNIKVLTLSSFYRLYSVSLIKKIKHTYGTIIKEDGFISMIEILLKAIKVKASIIEVPVKLLSDRRKGDSKMKKLKTSINYLTFLMKTDF